MKDIAYEIATVPKYGGLESMVSDKKKGSRVNVNEVIA